MRSARTLALAGALALAACERDAPFDPLPPAPVDADGDATEASHDCDDHDARVYWTADAYRDRDGDGFGSTPGQVCIGSMYVPEGWAFTPGDCDDTDGAAWRPATIHLDADGDGVGEGAGQEACIGAAAPAGWSLATGDCAPLDAGRWGPLEHAFRDADGDGRFVPGAGSVCAGAALPAGYARELQGTLDCDDGDAGAWAVWAGFADADGDGVGTDAVETCGGAARPEGTAANSGDCAAADATAWRWLTYSYVDGDLDGATSFGYGQLCAGAALPPGYSDTSAGDDCDDADPGRALWRSLLADGDRDGYGAGTAEPVCTDGTVPDGWAEGGDDCAPADASRWRPHAYMFRDADADTRTVPEAGSLCLDDGPVPAGYLIVANGLDCDDADAAVWASVTGYVDADADGVGVAPGLVTCTGGALPAGQAAAAGDCAADDATRWRVLSYGYADRDGDGATAVEAGQICAGATLPDPYRLARAGNDCDDATTALWRWVVVYPDGDGDGIGAPPRQIPCLGAELPAGFSLEGWDEDDADPERRLLADDPSFALSI